MTDLEDFGVRPSQDGWTLPTDIFRLGPRTTPGRHADPSAVEPVGIFPVTPLVRARQKLIAGTWPVGASR